MEKNQVKKTAVTIPAPDGEVKAILTEEVNDNSNSSTEEENADFIAEKIAPYLSAYPNEKEFHITSDGQVFLGKDLLYARVHQHSLKDGKEVHSFTVEKTA